MRPTITDEKGDSRDQHVDAGPSLISRSMVSFLEFEERIV